MDISKDSLMEVILFTKYKINMKKYPKKKFENEKLIKLEVAIRENKYYKI
jgi:hypothetical protein